MECLIYFWSIFSITKWIQDEYKIILLWLHFYAFLYQVFDLRMNI